jgi:hypothetical protein
MMLFMIGCGGCHEDKPLQKVELSPETEQLKVEFRRFDLDLFNTDFNQPVAASQQLYQKYGNFFCEFVESDLQLAACTSDSVGVLLKPFVSNKDIRETHDEIIRIFSEEKIQSLNTDFTDCMKRWNHFFPDSLVPQVIYYQSAWNTNIATTDSSIGIALDCYLGPDNKITKSLSTDVFPRYKKQNMDEKFLVADAMKGWAAWKFKKYYDKKDFLSELIFYGKLMYVAEALSPETPDSIMMSWSGEQYQWAKEHEMRTWKTIANEKVMYTTKGVEINKWFADGPFTGAQGVPQDSPPQLGVWTGWNIVRQYMAAHPEVTLKALMEEKESLKILSGYRPEK